MLKRVALLALAVTACGPTEGNQPERPQSEGAETTGSMAMGADLAAFGDLGSVSLDAGCSPVANDLADQALALLHHMTYVEAQQTFAAAVEADGGCTMGYWGQAMTIIHPLWPDEPGDAGIARGQELIELAEAQTAPEGRPAAYLQTVAAYFEDGENRTERERLASFAGAWAEVQETYPDDLEARSFAALTHLSTADPTDKTYPERHQALDWLDRVLEEIPDHPGAHHYVIHARDVPELAEEGVEVARSYAKLSPDVPHALHMPTHIYTRVGYWEESIDGNARSAESAWASGQRQGGISTHFHHALDYLAYAHLQRAEDDKAYAVLERAIGADGPWAASNYSAIAYALAAIPARYAIERRDWAGAMALEPRQPAGFPWDDRFAPFEAITHFARGLAGARSGNVGVADAALQELAALGEKVTGTGANAYWASQVEVQSLAIRAWLAFEAGDQDEGLRLMSQAADLEASIDKHAVTPGELVPAAELLGEMRLAAGDPTGALASFEAALSRSPERLNGLAGAARSAVELGRGDLAERYYGELVALTASAEVERPEMREARAFLGELDQ